MYKDKDQQREANRLAAQRKRDKGMTQGMTNEGYDAEGMTRIGFIQQELKDPLVLYGIERAARIFDDRDVRYERAYNYYLTLQ